MDLVAYQELAQTEELGWYYRARLYAVANLLTRVGILPTNSRDKKILDVGCGTGGSTLFYKQYGEVTGLEPSTDAVSWLKKRFPDLDVVVSDVDGSVTKLQNRKFDLISILGVLYHRNIADPEKALRIVAGFQKQSGYLIWNECCYKSLWREHDDVVHGARRFTPRQMRQIAEAAGYEVLHGGHLISWAFPLGLMLGLIYRLRKWAGIAPGLARVDHQIPNPLINESLFQVTKMEWRLGSWGLALPFGVSYLLVARKR